jgi:hypothetical protein
MLHKEIYSFPNCHFSALMGGEERRSRAGANDSLGKWMHGKWQILHASHQFLNLIHSLLSPMMPPGFGAGLREGIYKPLCALDLI